MSLQNLNLRPETYTAQHVAQCSSVATPERRNAVHCVTGGPGRWEAKFCGTMCIGTFLPKEL